MNNAVGPTFQLAFHLVNRFSKVIQPLLIDEFDVAVRRQSNDMSRNPIDDQPTILFARAQGLVGWLWRVDVHRSSLQHSQVSGFGCLLR
jgi:hypothetical protein